MEQAAAILGVRPDCPHSAWRKQYRSLALKMHPDQGGNADDWTRLQAAQDIMSRRDRPEEDQPAAEHPSIVTDTDNLARELAVGAVEAVATALLKQFAGFRKRGPLLQVVADAGDSGIASARVKIAKAIADAWATPLPTQSRRTRRTSPSKK